MKKCPAELLFGRRYNTKPPDLRTNPAKERKDIVEAKKVDKMAKERMKMYKDAGRYVKDHNIEVGDLVISKKKTTKHNSVYDPKPYKVVTVHGMQIKGMRKDGKSKTRDSQMWKRVQVQARRRYGDLESTRSASKYLDDTDIGAGYQDVRTGGSMHEDAATRTMRCHHSVSGYAGGRGQVLWDRTAGAEGGRGAWQDEHDPRHDIQARLRRSSNVIMADTLANRPQRSRLAIVK